MNPKIHGHRGARGRRPENTLAAVEYALREAADGVEVDLCVTADDTIVLHHDLCLNPDTTRDAKGKWITERVPIRELMLDTLRQCDIGRLKPGSDYALKFPEQIPVDGARIPVLDEFVELVGRHSNNNVVLNLELKSDPRQPALTPEPEYYATLVTDKLESLRLPNQIFLQSFDWKLIELLKKELTKRKLDFKTGFTKWQPYGPADLEEIKHKGGDVLSCDYTGLTKPLVRQAHDRGLKIYAWTVNEEQDIERIAGLGVDVITTDYPERCRALLYGGG